MVAKTNIARLLKLTLYCEISRKTFLAKFIWIDVSTIRKYFECKSIIQTLRVLLKVHNNGKKGVYNYMQFCYSFNHEINEFCYFALFSETQSRICAMCISLHVCVSLFLSLCVPYCLTVCFRCDLFRFECMCVCVYFFAFSAAAVENPLFLFSRMVDCLVCIITYLLFIR